MSRVRAAVRWPFAVTLEWLANIATVLRAVSPADVVPPWVWEQIWSTIDWVTGQVPNAAGYRATPYEQMTGAVSMAVMMVIVSIGILTPLSLLMLIPFGIGAARLHPVVDRLWPLAKEHGGNPV